MQTHGFGTQRDAAQPERVVDALSVQLVLESCKPASAQRELVFISIVHVLTGATAALLHYSTPPEAQLMSCCTNYSDSRHVTRAHSSHSSLRTLGTTARNLGRAWSAKMRWSARLLRAVLRMQPRSAQGSRGKMPSSLP